MYLRLQPTANDNQLSTIRSLPHRNNPILPIHRCVRARIPTIQLYTYPHKHARAQVRHKNVNRACVLFLRYIYIYISLSARCEIHAACARARARRRVENTTWKTRQACAHYQRGVCAFRTAMNARERICFIHKDVCCSRAPLPFFFSLSLLSARVRFPSTANGYSRAAGVFCDASGVISLLRGFRRGRCEVRWYWFLSVDVL